MPNSESSQTRHQDLDLYNTAALVDAFVGDQAIVVAAAQGTRSAFARIADEAAPRLAAGGRLINADAGTSGRLGVLDSVELLPALGWTRQQAPGFIAGGPAALLEAVEDAGDSAADGRNDIQALALNRNDVLLALSASGATPYPMGAAMAAREAGALTMGLANNPDALLIAQADIGVLLDTGSEVISGSTRLKADTAQKIAINTSPNAILVRTGKALGNPMIDLVATNAMHRQRALGLTVRAALALAK